MLIDGYGRKIDYLRISITDLCNLNCIYCRGGQRVKKRDRSWVLSFEEMLRIARLAGKLGITRIRITGGEPLVRKGVVGFIEKLAEIEGLAISMTTNSLLLKKYAEDLHQAGLGRLNISLDSLNEERYRYITQGGSLQDALTGIDEALRVGFKKTKINIVPLSGINNDEVEEFVDFGLQCGLDLRFIELMPITDKEFDWKKNFVSTSKIKERLNGFNLVPVDTHQGSGPAKYFRVEGSDRLVGFISPMSNGFCEECNRLRLTPDGRLRPCLGNDLEIDLKGPIRSGATDGELVALFLEAVRSKPKEHKMCVRNPGERGMRALGG